MQDLGCFRKLNIGVIDNLDAVAPRVEEVQERAIHQFGARFEGKLPDRGPVIHDQAEVAMAALRPGRDTPSS